MRRRDWQLLGLAMFASPLVVIGAGAALSHGHAAVALVAVTLLAVLAIHLGRRARAPQPHHRSEPGHRRS